ncbi:hypothetical protein Hanom_Chr08g00726671 [Helianthus anomalus]
MLDWLISLKLLTGHYTSKHQRVSTEEKLSYHHQYRIKKHLKYMKLVTEKMNYHFLTSNQEKIKGAVVGI